MPYISFLQKYSRNHVNEPGSVRSSSILMLVLTYAEQVIINTNSSCQGSGTFVHMYLCSEHGKVRRGSSRTLFPLLAEKGQRTQATTTGKRLEKLVIKFNLL